MAYDLKNVVIPDTVVVIGYGAFRQCKGLETITIPQSVRFVENLAFYGCDNLKKITINGPSFISIGQPWGAENAEIEYNNEIYFKFAENYLANKSKEELEEILLKSARYIGTFEEYLNTIGKTREEFEKEAENAGMTYIEYLKQELSNTKKSWLMVEYMVSIQGGEGKTVEELEQILIEGNGLTGSFEDLLAQEGMNREDFENMIKENGFRTEEDYLKYVIYFG